MGLLADDHQRELERLCPLFHVRRLELFGSAVHASLDQARDLDFLVEFQILDPGTYMDSYFGLLEALEDLFGKPVDLVVSRAISNPYFRQSVDRTKVLVYWDGE